MFNFPALVYINDAVTVTFRVAVVSQCAPNTALPSPTSRTVGVLETELLMSVSSKSDITREQLRSALMINVRRVKYTLIAKVLVQFGLLSGHLLGNSCPLG